MRNLIEYPITMKEAKDVLETAYMRETDDDRYGNISGVVLHRILELFDTRFKEEDFDA